MQTIVDGARELTNSDGASVEILDGDEMIYVASSGATANTAMGLRLKVTQSLSGLYVKENRVSKCRDTETDGRVDRAACRKIGVRSMIVLPLLTTRSVVGVLKVFSDAPDFFSSDQENA